MDVLQAGDHIVLAPSGEPWRVRQVLPRRLRLSSDALLHNGSLQQRLINASLHLSWVQAIRVNTLAGSLVIVHSCQRSLRRRQLQALLHLALRHEHDQALAFMPRASSTALWHLTGTTGLLAGVGVLGLPAWPGLLLFIGLCYLPLAARCLRSLGQRQLAGSWLDLFWFSSLLLQASPVAVLLEWTLETAGKVFKAWTPSPGFAEAFQKQLQGRLTDLSFAVQQIDGSWQHQPFEGLAAGDRLLLGPGDPLPAHGLVVDGQALVSTRWRDGDPRLLSARAFQQLPFGTIVIEGQLQVRLVCAPMQDPELRLLQRLLHKAQLEAARTSKPSLLRDAERWHQASVPYLLIAGAALLVVGPHGSAGALMQFDPASDWQLSASLTYGDAQRDLLWQGLVLRRAEAIDALAHCQQLLVSESVVLSTSQWHIGGIYPLPFQISRDELIQAVAGFRCHQKPHGLHPLRGLLEEEDLMPAVVEGLRPLGVHGVEGRIKGNTYQFGGQSLLQHLRLQAPAELITSASETLLYLVHQGQVLGAVGFEMELSRHLVKGLRQLQRAGWQLHLLVESHSELLEDLAGRLHQKATATYTAANPHERNRVVSELRQKQPLAMLGNGALDALCLAQVDLSIELLNEQHGLSGENADLMLRPEALTTLAGSQMIALEASRRHRRNLALVLVPHLAVVLLNLVLPLNPVLAVLSVDLPVLLAELGRVSGGQEALRKPNKKAPPRRGSSKRREVLRSG